MTLDLEAFCAGESLYKLQMFGVKARLSRIEESYECVKCKFVIEMIKRSHRGIDYHTAPTNIRMVVRGSVDLSKKGGRVFRKIHNAFFPPGCGATLVESSSADL